MVHSTVCPVNTRSAASLRHFWGSESGKTTFGLDFLLCLKFIYADVLNQQSPDSQPVTGHFSVIEVYKMPKIKMCPTGSSLLCTEILSTQSKVEQERNLLQPRPYWKEFRFDLTPLPQGETVTAAEFRIYKTMTVGQRANRTLHISVYEIKRENRNREPELVLLDMQSVPAGQEGWLAFDVTSASNHWLLQPRSNLGIRLYVETEDDRSLSAGWIGLVGRRGPRSKQPFMVTFFRQSQIPCRPPRAVRPHPRRKKPKYDLPIPTIHGRSLASKGQLCKKHELYVSFSDLGWKDWVLAPTGYSAYYCDGECIHPMGACMNATNHAIIQQVVHLMKPNEVPSACCAPTKLSSISVLFYDDNNNVILKKHRNMVVKTCGCL
ncbi:bone morphogenetic protein 8A isoform X2 [Girardinichthys multiradiatus]|uniref:bone morphogenetic protein 8A isoform X2 n=1 Tax=Girardinichthys multiradiatus TaxID=208333 RepID=UPI001FAD1D58|nr:bone morphogenetic protein 8A isoform X2 [Girardinichthys multiradiatus]